MALQETPALTPFMRELLILPQIAGRASHHNIRNIVRATPRERDNMISVIGVSQLSRAIVTFGMLTAFLIKQLLRGIATRSRLLHRPSSMRRSKTNQLPMIRSNISLSIRPSTLTNTFPLSLIIPPLFFKHRIFMFQIMTPPPFKLGLFMILAISPGLLKRSILMLLIVAMVILPNMILSRLNMFFSTSFALRVKTIPTNFICMKKLKSSREKFFAGSALPLREIRRYTVHTDETNPFIRHGSGVLPARAGLQYSWGYYSIKPPVEQVQGVS